jgi:hypothetical protein
MANHSPSEPTARRYGIFKLDKKNKKVTLSLRGEEVMNTLNDNEAKEGLVV